VRTALGASLNVPAVRTLVMVSPERFAQHLRQLGLPIAHNGDYYGYSLALGSAEVTLASLTNAYRALAQGGQYTSLRWLKRDALPPARPLLSPQASYIVADMLADREARVPTFGLDNALAARYWAAVKTGTSKDMRDNWCVGFSKRYTVGVWVGNASGEPMWDVSGVTGAAPIWRALMDELNRHETAAAQAPLPPPGLVQQAIHYEPALEPSRDEWFITGTEQGTFSLASAQGRASALIQSPQDGTVLALDPDIPLKAQRVRLLAVAGLPARWAWRMDGQRLGPAIQTAWPLWPGKHQLDLLDERGVVKASARFEVRGARVRASRSSAPRIRPS
jgi:penicillin-binding protein 1C